MMNQIEEKIKFSVVLPIYNVEKYLNRCLDSVMNQTYKKLEIILVDDGSPDSCPQMCDNWARVDDRIKVVHKKNAGLGEARNSGLDVATGDYIAFFDSDDYIDTRLFEELYTVIISDNPDLIEFGHHDVDRQGNITRTFIPKTPLEKYEGKEVLSQFLPELICTDPKTGTASDLLMSAWSCLYRRQLLVECNFQFVSEREYISEDVYSLMKLMGNDLFDNATSIKRIICPAENAYSKLEAIKSSIRLNVEKDTLILGALGPTASILASQLCDEGYQFVDIGHVDVEYMWYLRHAILRETIEGKYVNESGVKTCSDVYDNDSTYINSIIDRVLS